MTAPAPQCQPSIVEQIRSRPHDAPMPTERLLDMAGDLIEFLEFEWNRATEGMQDRDKRIQELEGALRRLDKILDFSDENLDPVWIFEEDMSGIQEAFAQAHAALSSGNEVGK